MLQRAEDLAYGNWPEILNSLGVDSSYFRGKAGPCPFCADGGKDRYIWQDKNGGRYLCRHCTDARYRSGMDFLMRFRACTFVEACNLVREHFNVPSGYGAGEVLLPKRDPVRKEPVVDVEAARARMQRVWDQSRPITPSDPLDLYLRSRVPRLVSISPMIHLHPRLGYYRVADVPSERPVLVGYFPAMLVRGFDAAGNLVQLHKTYLTPGGAKADVPHVKKTDRGVGCNSFALRLDDPVGNTLGVSEGIETALAASLLDGLPVWPCHSAGILANFVLPEHLRGRVTKIVIYADSDELKNGHRAGIEAAKALADRCRRDRIRTMIVRPAKVGADMADLAVLA